MRYDLDPQEAYRHALDNPELLAELRQYEQEEYERRLDLQEAYSLRLAYGFAMRHASDYEGE